MNRSVRHRAARQLLGKVLPRLAPISRQVTEALARHTTAAVVPAEAEDIKWSWDFLHPNAVVFCICLIDNHERFAHCQQQFERVGLTSRMRYYRPERHPDGGLRGCWQSHYDVLKHAYQMQAPYVVVFEDDVVFTADFHKSLAHIRFFLEHEPDWNLFRLGSAFIKGYGDRSHTCPSEIWRIASLATHAYIASREFIVAFVERGRFEPGRGVDEHYMVATTKDYALVNPICWQSSKFNSQIDWGEPGSTRAQFQNFIHNAVNYELWQRGLNRVILTMQYIPKEIRPRMPLEKQGVKFAPSDEARLWL